MEKKDEKQAGEINEEDGNIDIPQRGKYNFYEISKNLYGFNYTKEDKEGNFMRDLSLKNEIAEYRKLKNLEQIENIGNFQE